MKYLSTLLLLLAFAATTSAQTTNQVVFSFDHQAAGLPLELGQSVFSIWNNKKVQLSRAEFYISEVELQHPDGTMLPLSDQYLLVNASAPTTEFTLGSWPVEAAHGAILHLGVPQTVNHNDPTAWPSNHALAPKNPSMHWGWAAGYRFMAIEGKVDNNGDGLPETDFTFHNLGDALYKTVELTGLQMAENGVLHLQFKLDYAQLFKGLTMTGNLTQHGSGSLNIDMMKNAAVQNFILLPAVSGAQQVEANSLNISALPNPANSATLLDYTLPAKGAIDLILINTLGQTVRNLTQLAASGSIRLETTALPNGIYQYAFYENGHLLARKQLVIQH